MISKKQACDLANTAHIRASLKAIEDKIIIAANAGLFEVELPYLSEVEEKALINESFCVKKEGNTFIVNWQIPSWGCTSAEIRKELIYNFSRVGKSGIVPGH